jgi:hypothetical protein
VPALRIDFHFSDIPNYTNIAFKYNFDYFANCRLLNNIDVVLYCDVYTSIDTHYINISMHETTKTVNLIDTILL